MKEISAQEKILFTQQTINKMTDDAQQVKELGDKIGYGHMMTLASALWRKSLGQAGIPTDAAFVTTCLPFMNEEDQRNTLLENELYDKLVSD